MASGAFSSVDAPSQQPAALPRSALGCGGLCHPVCTCCDSNREDVLTEAEHARLLQGALRAQEGLPWLCRDCGPCKTRAEPDEAWAWAWHAWARAPYAIAASAFLAPYLTTVAGFAMDDDGYVRWLGFPMRPTSYFSIASTISSVIAAVVLPFLGSLSDHSPYRKQLLIVMNTIGSVAAMCLVMIVPSLWWLGAIFFIIGSVMYEATLVYIYPYLPEIAPVGKEHKRSRISALGVVYGNGSQVLLAIVLSGLLFVAAPADPEMSNPSFEDETLVPWAASNPRFAVVEDANAEDGHWSARIDNTLAAFVNTTPTVPPGLGYLAINNTDTRSVYAGRKMLVSAYVSTDAAYTKPRYRLNVFDGLSWASSKVEEARDTYGGDVRLITTLSDDATAFQVQLEFQDAAVYHVDDLTLTPDANLLQPICMLVAGVWWFTFAIQSFRNLYARPASLPLPADTGYCYAGCRQLCRTLANVRGHSDILRFLLGYLFYDNGLSAILALIGTFLQVQLRMSGFLIGIALLWAQIVGIFGAAALYKLGQKWSIKGALLLSMFFFLITPILAFLFLRGPGDQYVFFLIAIPAGCAIGGAIALTRTMYSGMIPKSQEAEFMGLLTFFSKITLWSGTLVYTVVNEVTGEVRYALLSLSGFFALSIFFFAITPYDEAKRKARLAAETSAAELTHLSSNGGNGNGDVLPSALNFTPAGVISPVSVPGGSPSASPLLDAALAASASTPGGVGAVEVASPIDGAVGVAVLSLPPPASPSAAASAPLLQGPPPPPPPLPADGASGDGSNRPSAILAAAAVPSDPTAVSGDDSSVNIHL